MKISYSEECDITNAVDALEEHRSYLRRVVDTADLSKPESALVTWKDDLMKEGLASVVAALGDVQHVVLIGIGGSSLGVEAVHATLRTQTKLHVLDCIDPYRMEAVIHILAKLERSAFAICIVSKSGTTTETLTNADVLMHALEAAFGEPCYDRMVCIGDPDNPLLQRGQALGAQVLPMHQAIGGRYCVFTAAGLAPLALLGHDVTGLLEGARRSFDEAQEHSAAQGAAMLHHYMQNGMHSLNFFAFDTHLAKVGFWYRQLTAESLGKEYDRDGQEVHTGFVPTVSTPVELHSTGQLYFSGFPGVFTDIVHIHDDVKGYTVSHESTLAPKLADRSMQDIQTAIFEGVVGAYHTRGLPYRITTLPVRDERSVGNLLGIRMLETMYLAELLNINAFDQPNVELYKDITRKQLDI